MKNERLKLALIDLVEKQCKELRGSLDPTPRAMPDCSTEEALWLTAVQMAEAAQATADQFEADYIGCLTGTP